MKFSCHFVYVQRVVTGVDSGRTLTLKVQVMLRFLRVSDF